MKVYGVLRAIVWVLPVVWAMPAPAQTIKVQRISFTAGTSSATVKGTITGAQIVDYKLGAKAGQTMSITLKTSNGSNYFNVLPPGSETALFVGSTSGDQWTGALPADGEYTVRVYLMRSAARRNEKASYTLTTGITGSAVAGDAKVAGTPYHATGEVRCVMASGKPQGSCPFGVTREGKGSGMVKVTKPDGRGRVIFFDKGRATGYDESQADPGQFKVEKKGDVSIIHIGQERYEIPDAVIFGG